MHQPEARREVAMNRSVFAPALALLLCAAVSTFAFAQAQPAKPTTPSPAAKAKFVTPIKGVATIEVIKVPSKYVGKDIVTVYKIKNTSNAPIALLKVDEFWYDKSGKLVSSAEERYRQPFPPGEIVEITTRAPQAAGVNSSQSRFSHANGTIKPTAVKEFKK
jgi:hypothetical protein